MKILAIAFGLLLLRVGICQAEDPFIIKSKSSADFARGMMLLEASKLGYSGDSMDLEIRESCSLVMRMYSVVDGKPKLVQSSRPESAGKSFSFGYMFRPTQKGRTVSFLLRTPYHELVKDPVFILENEQPKPHFISDAIWNDLSSETALVAPTRMGEECIIYSVGKNFIEDNSKSLKDAAKKIGKGYIITATLTLIVGEQVGTGQPATRPESKLKGSDKPQPHAEGRSR